MKGFVMTAASIRSNNPGAMWGSAIAKKWGATKAETLNDGLGQGNNIAYFPTQIQGACAQFDLWRSSYCNMTLKAAITKWSGGNWSQPYADFLTQKTGLSMSTVITPIVLAGPSGLALIKYQAQWEAGQVYPMKNGDADWKTAQTKVFAPTVTKVTKQTAVVGGAVIATTTAVTQAVKSGTHWGIIVGIVVAGVVAIGVSLFLIHKYHKGA